MDNQFIQAIERAITKVVLDFQEYPDRFWNERDIHWSLFYYLKREDAIQEAYPTQLIRAEFPTIRKFDGARGHYDVVVLDPKSYNTEAIQRMKASDPWDEYLKLLKVTVAVEIKLWLARLPLNRADWDIQKLTEMPNNVLNAYFLNFIQLYFKKEPMKKYFEDLKMYMQNWKKRSSNLNILCVPSDTKIQPNAVKNWL